MSMGVYVMIMLGSHRSISFRLQVWNEVDRLEDLDDEDPATVE